MHINNKILINIIVSIALVASSSLMISANNYKELTENNTRIQLEQDINSKNFDFREPDISVFYFDEEKDTSYELSKESYTCSLYYEDKELAAKIQGKGRYTGKVSEIIETSKIDLNKCSVVLSYEETDYTGKSKYPMVQVYYNGSQLRKHTDYDVEYVNNLDVGKAKVEVIGQGLFSGTTNASFYICDTNKEDTSEQTEEESQPDASFDTVETTVPIADEPVEASSPFPEVESAETYETETTKDIEVSSSTNLTSIDVSCNLIKDYDYILISCSKYKDFSDSQVITISNPQEKVLSKFSELDVGNKHYIKAEGFSLGERTSSSNVDRAIIYGMYDLSTDTQAYHTDTHENMGITLRNGYYCGFYDDDNPNYCTVIAGGDYFAIAANAATLEANGTILPTSAISQLGEGIERATACTTTCCEMILKYEFGIDISKEQTYLDAHEMGYADTVIAGMYTCYMDDFLEAELENYDIDASFSDRITNRNSSFDDIKEYINSSLNNGHRVIITVQPSSSWFCNNCLTSSYLTSSSIRHAVLIVGYTYDESGENYYIADPYYKERPAKNHYYYGLRKVACSTVITSFLNINGTANLISAEN